MKNIFIKGALYFVLSIFAFAPLSAFADGMILSQIDPYDNRWDFSAESSQQALIHYDKGRQNMLISIGMSSALKDSLWLFPIPAEAKDIELDILTFLPSLNGENIYQQASFNLEEARKYTYNSQIYPLWFSRPYTYRDGLGLGATEAGFVWGTSSGVTDSEKYGVDIIKKIEKEGMTSEVVTAKSADGFYQYLKSKSLNINEGSIPVLDSYIGRDYSFIASWINPLSNLSELGDVERGVFVSFSTDRLFFPLKPTSVYGEKNVPAEIRVIGYVTPNVPESLQPYTSTEYYVGDYDPETINKEKAEKFYSGRKTNVPYTKITINAPSNVLTEDLWMNKRVSLKVHYTAFLARNFTVSFVILFIICSILSSLLAGLIFWPAMRRKPWELILLAIFNGISIIGVIIAVILHKGDDTKIVDKDLVSKLREAGFIKLNHSKIFFVIFFSVFFMIISFYIFNFASRNIIEESRNQSSRWLINKSYPELQDINNKVPNLTTEDQIVLTDEESRILNNKNQEPIIWFKMDEEQGKEVTSSGKLTRIGNVVNEPIWKSGEDCILGSCLQFNNSYMQFYFPPLEAYTVSLWVKRESSQVGERQILGLTNDRLGLTIYNDNRFLFYDGMSLISKTRAINGSFHHVVITNDGSNKNIYIDGVKEASSKVAYLLPYSGRARLASTADSTERLFNGSIDDMRIYNYALQFREIQKIYEEGKNNQN